MMNGIIIFKSKYGATKKYAEWLSEDLHFDCVEIKNINTQQLMQYDTIILGGGIYASGIAGLSFLKKNIDKLSGKKIIVYCVGASPYEEEAFSEIYKYNFKDKLEGIKCFYYRGAWKENEMSFPDRTLCKMLQNVVAKKDPATLAVWEKALMSAVGQNCDWTDREYIKPVVEYVKGLAK
ncbi:MAG: flavodoxin domain-containing protein [Spirochaetaceae bacterium]|jgi:menaquinone-dependent protoporphyrinogen IX oxidase|nr:flavodoxin domain-containing protein [Spirochaetaceae bacterium]